MTVTVDVPERITRAQLRAVAESFGLSLDGLVALRFERDGIHAIVFARNAEGKYYLGADNKVATHVISIPLED